MTEPGFGALRTTLRIFCIIPFLTGAVDMIGGARFLAATGAHLPPASIADPLLNNQMGFWGGIWFGFGITLWYATARLRAEPTLLRILLGVLFLSGLGRAISVVQHGWTAPVLSGAMLLELIGPAIIWPWHARLLLFGWRFLHAVFRNGNYAVTMFFVISGFLITSNADKRWRGLRNLRALTFYRYRAARIMPTCLCPSVWLLS